MNEAIHSDPALFDGKLQGGKTIQKWRNEILMDWAERWNWLKEQSNCLACAIGQVLVLC
ncbi:hypothetical protein [Algoriphagus sp. A40]|uniref:hypothetical protein n=1 Tax=Algoriphagus sp. A40 TaxID=1945863 RepID=UPI00143AE2D0|nr:hypothetical protein [Algoriphagus sp. A40]